MESETALKEIEAGQVNHPQVVPHPHPVPCQDVTHTTADSPSVVQLQHFEHCQATAPPQSILPLHAQQANLPLDAQGMQPLQTQGMQPLQTQGMQPLQTQGMQPLQIQGMQPLQTQGMQPLQTQGMQPLQTQGVPIQSQQAMQPLQTQQAVNPLQTQQAMQPLQTQGVLIQTQPAMQPSQTQPNPCEQPLLAQSSEATGPPRRYESGLSKCLRGILYFYNICFFILGSAAIGMGIWLLMGDVNVQYLTVFVGQYQYLPLAIYLLTAGGSIAVFVAVLGVFAIYQENKYALGIYGVVMFMSLIAFGISSQMSVLSKEMLSGGIRDNMRETLTSSYGVDIMTDEKNRQITESWDHIQKKFQCCGVSGGGNSTDSWALYMTGSLWYNIQQTKAGGDRQKVPYSCCKGDNYAICTGQEYWPGPPNHLNPRKAKHKKENLYLHTTGCYDQLVSFLMTYSNVVPKLAGFASSLYSLFGITSFIVAVCLMIFTKQKLETRLR